MVFRAINRGALHRAAVAASVVLGGILLAGQGVAPVQAATVCATDPCPTDPNPLQFLSPLNGAVSTTGKFMVVGSATLAETVEVYAWRDGTPESDRTLLCTSAVMLDPATYQLRWGCGEVTLARGNYTITAFSASYATSVTVTVNIPVAFTVDDPEQFSTVDTATPTISGHGTPGETVTVAAEPGGPALCTATIAEDTTWSCVVPPLTDGSHNLALRLGTTEQGLVIFTVAVPPTISSPASGATLPVGSITFSGTAAPSAQVLVWKMVGGARDSQLCSVTSDSAGLWTCSYVATASDAGPFTVMASTTLDSALVDFTIEADTPEPPVITSPAPNSTVTTATPTVSGTAAPGAQVTITTSEGGDPVCTTTADDSGAWSCTVSELPDGDVTLYVTAGDGETVSVAITVATESDGDGEGEGEGEGEGDGDGDGTTASPEQLARTGSESSSSALGLGLVFGMILTGSALLVARNRRSTAPRR
jgi:LPXTG-motif cell wall-anchored protein